MQTALVAGLVLFGFQPVAHAADTRDYAIEITALTRKSPASITLNWRATANTAGVTVSRKAKDATSWTTVASLGGAVTTWTDTSVQPGVGYEYGILKTSGIGAGYIYAGIELPLVENRGKMILLVDSTHAAALSAELARLQQDLRGDGWVVLRQDVSRTQSPAQVKAAIKNLYNQDPANTKALFIFGHVPVPYSGDIAPDGHQPDHKGAWPADVYYADMDGNWTDSSVNNSGAARPQNRNIPGDGKFDQGNLPSNVELQVGRVDLINLPGFAPKTEIDLLRQYLNKDHNFRHGKLPLARKGLINDNFGDVYGEAFASSGWRNFAPFFGSENITSIPGYQFFTTLKDSGYLWSYACGGGAYNSCNYVGGTGDWGFTDTKTVFTMLLGSYFGDWDADNSFLRGPLGSTTYGLTAVWAGRPHWFMHHMALGEPIGYSAKVTQNGGLYSPKNFERSIHVALMGDPTLRMHPVITPSNVSATRAGTTTVLTWAPSTDTGIYGYNVYRAASENGPYTRVNSAPIAAATFTDNVSSGNFYMVRALKLETTPSGSYQNASQGVFAVAKTGTVGQTSLTLQVQKISSSQLRFSYASTVGKQYAIESSPDLRSWSRVETVTALSTSSSFTRSSSGPVAFYRVLPL